MRYSIQKLDLMRLAIKELLTTYRPFSKTSGILYPPSAQEVEEHLRTYMLNGTTVVDLEIAADQKRAEDQKRREQMFPEQE